jgi:hypothetical protein
VFSRGCVALYETVLAENKSVGVRQYGDCVELGRGEEGTSLWLKLDAEEDRSIVEDHRDGDAAE